MNTIDFDPRGSEELGLAGPKRKARMGPKDTYLLVNDRDMDMEAYDRDNKLLFKIPALARGQGRDNEWRHRGTDTPPGLYQLGRLYRDYDRHPKSQDVLSSERDTAMSYGWYSFDMEEMENQERIHGRAGIMLHGGGSACGWPGAWAPLQQLFPTLGCIRIHNAHLRDLVLPRYQYGKVYVGVFQER